MSDLDELFEPAEQVQAANAAADAEARRPSRRKRQPEPEPTREMPWSQEGEQHVIACCLLDGSDTIIKARESGVTAETFYSAANRLLWEVISDVHAKTEMVSLETLAEELRTRRHFDAIGGFPYLMQITERAPTTAHSRYFIEKIREKEVLRQLIRASTEMVERAYAFAGDLPSLTNDVEESFSSVVQNARGGSDLLSGRDYDAKHLSPPPQPIYRVRDTVICTPGNLTAIYAQAKSGKTALVGAMLAAAMADSPQCDTLGFSGANTEGHAILHLDTEQSRYHFEQMIQKACERAGLKQPPPWLMSYHLTGLSAQQCRSALSMLIRKAERRFGKIRAIFLDGIGDMVVNPNDPDECFPFITDLHKKAIDHDCAVISVLHMNAGSENEKGRGHLGSQLERKCESNLTLEKESGVTRYWATKQRGKMITKDNAVAFTWSDEAQMHLCCDTPKAEKKAKMRGGASFGFAELGQIFTMTKGSPLAMDAIHRYARDYVSKNELAEVVTDAVKRGYLVREAVGGGFVYRLGFEPNPDA
jgi:hypothetical protein